MRRLKSGQFCLIFNARYGFEALAADGIESPVGILPMSELQGFSRRHRDRSSLVRLPTRKGNPVAKANGN